MAEFNDLEGKQQEQERKESSDMEEVLGSGRAAAVY